MDVFTPKPTLPWESREELKRDEEFGSAADFIVQYLHMQFLSVYEVVRQVTITYPMVGYPVSQLRYIH